MSPADDSLESVERSLAFSSLILLPYSNRAATAAASSWESSLDSSRVLGLLLNSIGIGLIRPLSPSPEVVVGFLG